MRTKSLLTRQLFRALITNRAYRIPGCPLQPVAYRRLEQTRPFSAFHRRQIFGLSFGSTFQALAGSKPNPANIETAVSKLVELVNGRRRQSRVPPDREIIDAFRFLFSARAATSKPLTRNEAFLAHETLDHLQANAKVLNDAEPTSLTREDLYNVLLVLAVPAGASTTGNDHYALATGIFDTLKPSQTSEMPTNDEFGRQIFQSYVTVLAQTGSSEEALRSIQDGNANTSLWAAVLKGFVTEGKTAEFWKTLATMQQRDGPLDSDTLAEICILLAAKNDPSAATRLLNKRTRDGLVPTTQCLIAILASALRNGKKDIAVDVELQLRTRTDLEDGVGTLLQYYASVDPSVQNIRARLKELEGNGVLSTNELSFFDSLINFAYSKRDPGLAQTYLELAESYGWRPDASTWISRLEFDLSRGDLDSAAEAFDALTQEEIPKDRSDTPVLNQYIAALTANESPNYEQLMRAVDSVLETGAEIEPDTLAGLSRVFLRRNELEDTSRLLRYRIDAFPRADRARIGAVFEELILDPNTVDQRAWNSYDLLRHVLPETPIETRLTIMQSFFTRNRPDLACLVFGHMRQHQDPSLRPTPEAYAQCFSGIAKQRDFDGLQMVFNMLKMDLEVDPNTKVHNSLMQAYTACRAPFTSLIDHFWKILESREGPTLSSFLLALQACETWVPQGGQEARRVLGLMQSWNMIISKEIYDTYIGAIAGQSEFENTVELIESMREDIGEDPDAITIGTFYNAIPFQYRKDEVEKWAKQRYPQLWEELLAIGDEIDEDWGIRYFRIDRTVRIDDELLFGQGEYTAELAKRVILAIDKPTE